jgi:MFS family permease
MKDKIWSKDFFFAWLALFFISSIMYMLNSTIAEYATAFGATASIAGLVSGIYTIGGLCSRLWGGDAMAKFGWKRITLIFAGLSICACGLYFVVSNVVLLLIVRFVHGLAFGACASGIIVIGSSVLPKSRHAYGMGILMLSTTFAVGIGPYAGSMIIDSFGAYGGFVMAMVCSAAIFVCIALTNVKVDPLQSKETKAEESSKPTGIRKIFEPSAIPISFCNMLFALSYAGVASFVRLYAANNDLGWLVAYFFLMQCIVLLVCQPVYGWIQDKTKSDNVVISIGITAHAVGVFLMFVYPSWISLVLGAVGTAMGYNSLKSATQAIATRGVTQERRSYAISTFWVFTDIGMGLGGFLLGFLVVFSGYGAIFLGSAILMAIALPVYWLIWGRKKGKYGVAQATTPE